MIERERVPADGTAPRAQAAGPASAPSRVAPPGGALSPAALLSLQKRAGNRAVLQLLARAGARRAADRAPTPPGRPLPVELRRRVEEMSGLGLDDVTVRYGSPRPASIGAAAYTFGSEIHLAPGQEQHLGHEAWHVVQQKQGRVRAEDRGAGLPLNTDSALEREADVRGQQAGTRTVAASGAVERVSRPVAAPVVQGMFTKAQLRHIASMPRDIRVEYLSHLSPEDLEEVAQEPSITEFYGATEEWDEIRAIRRNNPKPERGYRKEWLQPIPPGNAREAAGSLAAVGHDSATLEEAQRLSDQRDAFVVLMREKVHVGYLEDCAPDPDSEPKEGRYLIPGSDLSFAAPKPGQSIFLTGWIIASAADSVAAWRKHLLEGVHKSGEEASLPGRYGPEEDGDVDALIAGLSKLSIGSPAPVREPSRSVESPVSGPSSRPMSPPDRQVDDSGDVPMAEVREVVLRRVRPKPRQRSGANDVVPMDIDGPETIEVEMLDPMAMDVEVRNVDGHLDMDIDPTSGVTSVRGVLHLHLHFFGDAERDEVVDMDVDLDDMQIDWQAGDPVEMDWEHSVLDDLEMQVVESEGRLVASFLRYRDPAEEARQRKARKPGPLPSVELGEGGGSESGASASSGPITGRAAKGRPRSWEEDDDIAALTEGMSRLKISFISDIDNEPHEVKLADDLSDVIVKSNPVPLKTIIASGFWLGVAVTAAVTTAATAAQKALDAYAKNRSQTSGKTLRDRLRDVARALKNLNAAKKLPKPDLSKSENYPANSGTVEGKKVVAEQLSMNMKQVSGSGPTADGRLMTAIRKKAKSVGENKAYKQMHLLNDNCFGPGQLWNLTPGPAKSNVVMEKKVEDPLKRAIIDKCLVIDFTAVVKYNNDPMAASQKDLDENPDKYRMDKITFAATQYEYDNKAKSWIKPAKKTDPDVATVDGSEVRWDYGNLTRLRPKVKILSTTSTKELEDIGFSAGLAARLVALNTYNNATKKSPYALTEKADKAGKLKIKLQKYEKDKCGGAKKVMGWDKWDRKMVLWS